MRTRQGHLRAQTEFEGVAIIVPILFAVAPIVAAVACLTLSIIGLVGVRKYGGSDTDPKSNRGSVKTALVIFYSLVLAQGVLFLQWFCAWFERSYVTEKLSRDYFGNKAGQELVDRYITGTQDKCIENGVFGTTNRTLVSFAAELLQSEHPSDHVSAVSVLRVLTTRKKREAGAVKQICSSEQIVGNLFKLLRLKSPLYLELETKAETAEILTGTAEILTKLACYLRLTDIPGAAHSISSLLDPHPRFMKTAAKAGLPERPAPGRIAIWIEGWRRRLTVLKKCLRANEAGGVSSPPGETPGPTNNANQGGAAPQSIGEAQGPTNDTNQGGAAPQSTGETECFRWLPIKLRFFRNMSNICEIRIQINNTNEGGAKRDKPLIVHALMILDKLASDPGNCTEICKTTDLVPKILAPLTHGLLNTLGNNDPKTIQIVKASLRVVAKLTSGTCESSSKLRRELISENSRTVRNIIWIMRNSSDEQDISSTEPSKKRDEQEMRMLAVEILTRLSLGQPMELVQLMKADGTGTSTEHRAVAAECLAQICAMSTTRENSRHRLSSVSNSLSKVLETILTTEITDMTTERRKFLALFLGLAVRENLATTEDFENAVRGLPVGSNFAEKLKEIIVEMTKEKEMSEDVICLVITKAAAKLVTWTLSIVDPVQDYANYFQRENIVDKLNGIVKAMGDRDRVHDLEMCLVLRGDADEMGPYETLQTLVENVTNLIPPLPPQQH